MVVAEVPLWVVHNNNSSEQLQQSLQILENGVVVGSPPGAAAAAASSFSAKKAELRTTATAALSLLKQGKSMRSPIYSVDYHPTAPIFATGGGDGTVKIWNSGALFHHQRSSTTNSKGSVSEKEQDGEEKEALEDKKKKKKLKEGHYDPDTGAYVSSSSSSSGEDEGEEEDAKSSTSSSYENNELLQPSVPDIHDLSDRVRHKANGQQALSSPPRAVTNGNKQPNPFSSPTTATPGGGSKKRHQHHARLLATLTAHTGSCVLCVRFSNQQGRLLASAGDDAAVCIYRRLPDSHQWVRVHLCRGHNLDVVDLAWAPDDSHLVSASLDSSAPIIVWKLNSNQSSASSSMLLNPHKILGKQVHTSCVKGVTFDPAGSYLASSGDDPAICIWRAHDDWGLEQRVESIFDLSQQHQQQYGGIQESMFRRLSWSTDGSFICSTNSVVQKKHVASTISRENWNVSSTSPNQQAAHGGANLVGHRQPVVVSRHAPILLKSGSGSGSTAQQEVDDNGSITNDNALPQYATLLALGDKRGFVTVWTTKKSRPLFKMQCSESRCCVTDLAWGKSHHHGSEKGDLVLLVTLLDGQVVALRFGSDEIGPVLTPKEQARVFSLRYGIDVDDDGGGMLSGLFVGESGGPKFIENTLQMSLEKHQEVDHDDNSDDLAIHEDDADGDSPKVVDSLGEAAAPPSQDLVQQQQTMTTTDSKGRKRVRPVLVAVGAPSPKRAKESATANRRGSDASKQPQDPLQRAVEAAEKAARSTATTQQGGAGVGSGTVTLGAGGQPPAEAMVRQTSAPRATTALAPLRLSSSMGTLAIPYSTDRVHAAELPVLNDEQGRGLLDTTEQQLLNKSALHTAECTNSMKVPRGSNGGPVSVVDICLTSDGRVVWRDQLPGTACCSVAASKSFFVVGTTDGTIQLYGSSPSIGWKSGCSFRSHPPLVVGHPVVNLRLFESFQQEPREGDSASPGQESTEMLVVLADGSFAMYSLLPNLKLRFKGSVLPAMLHMALSASTSASSSSSGTSEQQLILPRLSRIQLTETGRLLMLLSLDLATTSSQNITADGSRGGVSTTALPESVGGALQAFVYDQPSELWMRMADSRFVLSDFYSGLPNSKTTTSEGALLTHLDDTVRIGSMQSPLKANVLNRGRDHMSKSIYNQDEDDSRNFVATRSHCEDRIACALAVSSSSEFKYWLGLYVRTLSIAGQSSMLRVLVDMLIEAPERNGANGNSVLEGRCLASSSSWWLSSAPKILNLERRNLVKTVIIPELSKNRSLQRLTNELSLTVADNA